MLQLLCIVATDHDGKKLIGVEFNMVNAERIAAIDYFGLIAPVLIFAQHYCFLI